MFCFSRVVLSRSSINTLMICQLDDMSMCVCVFLIVSGVSLLACLFVTLRMAVSVSTSQTLPYFHLRLSLSEVDRLLVPCPGCLLYMYLRCYYSTPQAMHIGAAHCLTRVNLFVFLDPPTSEVGPIDSQPYVRPFVRSSVRSFSRKPFIGFL